MSVDDLWGNLPDVEAIKTPSFILKEQAELLIEKTDGLLVGEITLKQDSNNNFTYTMHIVAPTLNNYTYSLLTVIHDITLYPLRVLMTGGNKWENCASEKEFKEELQKIFRLQKTQDVIGKLLTHIKSQ